MAKLINLDAVLGKTIPVEFQKKVYNINTDVDVERVLTMMREAAEVDGLPDTEKMARVEKTFDLISEVFIQSGYAEVTPEWVRKNLKWKQASYLLRAVTNSIMDVGTGEGEENPS